MLLSWKRQRREPLVQGYYIKWRGPPLSPDHSWVNVTDPSSESVVINGLRPFNNYEFFVIPYHQSIQGMPSNSLDGTTHEAAPSMPPSDVRLRMLNLTSLRVSWRPPPADAINGILKGFLINIRSNMSEERNITTNERATSVTLYRLIPEASYAIRVAARTNANFGVFFNGEPVVMNEETLRHHLRQASEASGNNGHAWYKQPLSVLAIGFILWCILLLMIILLWYRCCHRRRKQMSTKEREFIKIRDGSVANTIARDAFWAQHPSHTTQTLDSLGHQTSHSGGCLQDGYSDYGGSHTNCATLPQSLLYNMMHPSGNGSAPANCSTLQRTNGHSPPHHYHYCQLGSDGQHSHPPEAISTFQGQYYDDPSPYATTTLVMGGSSTGQRPRRSHRNGGGGGPATLRGCPQGPVLPSNPIPREPPRNFLSTQAVAAVHHDSQGSRASLRLDAPGSMEQHANSCAALLELNSESGAQRVVVGSTAGPRMKARRGVDSRLQQQERSSSVNVEGSKAQDNYVFSNRMGQQRDSPQTDVSYIQSSDNGTGGSGKVNGRSTPGNLLDLVPPPPRDVPPMEHVYTKDVG
uniref:Fibronectin type-III domain-containing protein n=1 Tax=Ditylenchus dipsaci TaxID=166011 RepID=A0A915DUB4_9BILA